MKSSNIGRRVILEVAAFLKTLDGRDKLDFCKANVGNLIVVGRLLGFVIVLSLPGFALADQDRAENLLQIHVFMSSEDHMGFGVASTIVYGEKEAVLIDAQFTNSNAHRVVAEILETGRNLTHIYITHEHPDHWLALPVIKRAFPTARVVSVPEVAKGINGSLAFNLEYWGKNALGINGAKHTEQVEALDQTFIMLEGQRLEVLGPFKSDAHESSSIWIPSIKTLVAGDAVFNQAHAWLADAKSPALRQAWLNTLDQLEGLNAEVVVPGHAPSANHLSPDSISYTRRYIETFIQKMSVTENSEQLISEMKSLYPDSSCELCLYYSVKILKGGLIWDAQWPPSLRNMEAR